MKEKQRRIVYSQRLELELLLLVLLLQFLLWLVSLPPLPLPLAHFPVLIFHTLLLVESSGFSKWKS
jgi:hypothetical protein